MPAGAIPARLLAGPHGIGKEACAQQSEMNADAAHRHGRDHGHAGNAPARERQQTRGGSTGGAGGLWRSPVRYLIKQAPDQRRLHRHIAVV